MTRTKAITQTSSRRICFQMYPNSIVHQIGRFSKWRSEQRLLHGLAKWSTRDCQYEIEVHAMRQRFQVYWFVRFCGKIALVILSDDSCITLPWRKILQMHFLNCIIFVQIISKKMEIIGNKILFEKIIWNLNFIIVNNNKKKIKREKERTFLITR